jgi:subtilisin family serine protease/subtilisin-like proprotein convertase family protein
MKAKQWRWMIVAAAGLLGVGVWLLVRKGTGGGEANMTRVVAEASSGAQAGSNSFALLSTPQSRAVAAVPAKAAGAGSNGPAFPFRLRNTERRLNDLMRSDAAVLLANALIDTSSGVPLRVPEHLQAMGDPGAYIVQSRGVIDATFRAKLESMGAQVVAYVPNNAYLVRASASAAGQMKGWSRAQAVLPYEPYFKLSEDLLKVAVEQKPLPPNDGLLVTVFADLLEQTKSALEGQGAFVFSQARSPFGPVLTVQAQADGLAALAQLPGVQLIEPWHPARPANDLSRETLLVSTDTTNAENYLGLSGTNVFVTVVDTGVDAENEDLKGRVTAHSPVGLVDTNGHGTHVAGIIAASGAHGPTNANGSVAGASFRGKAPMANIYSFYHGEGDPWQAQEAAALTNTLICNNSFGNGAHSYNIIAADYDWAVRDALPGVPGSQPVLMVFSAGNDGRGNWDGSGGESDTITSPGTSKNGITVGALEQYRVITNEVVIKGKTNQYWIGETSSSTEVAAFSSRGNTGVGVEGEQGRVKPDVVAPGVFVVSTRSGQWDTNAYYHPTNYDQTTYYNQVVRSNRIVKYSIYVPTNAARLEIRVWPNLASPMPMPDLPVYVKPGDYAGPGDYMKTNYVSIPPDNWGALAGNTVWYYSIGNSTNISVAYNVTARLTLTNDMGTYYEVLQYMNEQIGPVYRYESGTSMAAAGVSGFLALMQEFFEQRLHQTNSPALMKALLLSGTRSLPNYYKAPRQEINFQGWGLPSLMATLPDGLSNAPTVGLPLITIDQNPTNALPTGASRTWKVVVDPYAQGQPLRVTLAWTDPPGNPASSIKLVNDLDVILTNLDNGLVYVGNNIPDGTDYTQPFDTNTPMVFDCVNNVEMVNINGDFDNPLGTNYSVTVRARRVNVNAVTQHTNDMVQDFALVISAGGGMVSNAVTLVGEPVTQAAGSPEIFFIPPQSNGYPILNQHVGASSPLLGTNKISGSFGGWGPGAITAGETNQWRFYVMTNVFAATNTAFKYVAFVTFLPPDLSVSRMGTREYDDTNATRLEADIDLYVTQDPGLTNLTGDAILGADKSLTREGTEYVIYSNSVAGDVYYVGVKSEDQRASEFGLFAVVSDQPFANNSENGVTMRGMPVGAVIPDGTPRNPGAVIVMGINPYPVKVRRVVVTNDVSHDNFGDLFGALTHTRTTVVLNDHTLGNHATNQVRVYEDNNEMDIPGSQNTDEYSTSRGLRNFVGMQGVGVWTMTMIDNALTHTGTVNNLLLSVERTPDDLKGIFTIAAGGWKYLPVDVPPEATNMLIYAFSNNYPVEVYLREGDFPDLIDYDRKAMVLPPGNWPLGAVCGTNGAKPSLQLGIYDVPPLRATRYYVGFYNPNLVVATVAYDVEFCKASTTTDIPNIFPSNSVAILDDAVTNGTITVDSGNKKIYSVEVGVRLTHPRVSDLVLSLVGPDGTRVVLSDARGSTEATRMGGSVVISNRTSFSNSFETILTGNYLPGAILENWTVDVPGVSVGDRGTNAHTGLQCLELNEGGISRTIPVSQGQPCDVSFAHRLKVYRLMDGLVAWWKGENNAVDVVNGNNGMTNGGVTYTNGEVNMGFKMSRTNQFIVAPASSSLNVGTGEGMTMELWISPAKPHGVNPLMEWNNLSSFGAHFYVINGLLTANLVDVSGVWHSVDATTGTILTNVFQHVAVTYDKSSGLGKIYLNGTNVCTTYIGSFTPQTGFPFYIGHRPAQDGPYSFIGIMDEASLYNRALTDIEIYSIYAVGAAGKCGLEVPPAVCVESNFDLTVDGVLTNHYTASTNWQVVNLSFVAPTNTVDLEFKAPGVETWAMLDTITFDNQLVTTQYQYVVFTENTNRTMTPVKFALPPYGQQLAMWTNVWTEDFEERGLVPGSYFAPVTFPDAALVSWQVDSNRVYVISNRVQVYQGSNSLAIVDGKAHCMLPTQRGKNYTLSYAYRKVQPLDGIVSWWPGETNKADIVGPNNGFEGNIKDLVGYETNAYVGAGFRFDGTNWVRVPHDASQNIAGQLTMEMWYLDLSTNAVSGYGMFAKRGTGLSACNYGINVISNALGIYYDDPNFPGEEASRLLPAPAGGTYHHLMGSFLQLNTTQVVARTYIDGSLKRTLTLPGNLSQTFSTNYIAIGATAETGEFMTGVLDEVTLFQRALCNSEVRDAYDAGHKGKWGMATPPPQCPLGGALLSVDGHTNYLDLTNSWTVNTLPFTARGDNVVLELSALGTNSGIVVDSFVLTEIPSTSLYYLPEEDLKRFSGRLATGDWKLEIWDTRAGMVLTNEGVLESWKLSFMYQETVIPPIRLQPFQPVTNQIAARQWLYYMVEVPSWARFATNYLLHATGPAEVWFNQGSVPTNLPPSQPMLNAPPYPPPSQFFEMNTVSSTPLLLPGQTYYLGVYNNSAATITVGLEVDFNVLTLQNHSWVSNVIPPGMAQYYAYHASNGVICDFLLTNVTDKLAVVAGWGSPLPSLTDYDYFLYADKPDQWLTVDFETQPVPWSQGLWWYGVYNWTTNFVTNVVAVNERFLLTLTNGVPYTNHMNWAGSGRDYYRYRVSTNAVRGQFEINTPTSPNMLFVARPQTNDLGGVLYPATNRYDYRSARPGTVGQLVVIHDYTRPVGLTNGDWYLMADKTTGQGLDYVIKATEWAEHGTNIVIIGETHIDGTNDQFCMTWNSLVGAHYFIERTWTAESHPIWEAVSPNIIATSTQTTWCTEFIPPKAFFRVVADHLGTISYAPDIWGIEYYSTNTLLWWRGGTNLVYEMQWTAALPPGGYVQWETFTNKISVDNGFVTNLWRFEFRDDGSQTDGRGTNRFYRLMVNPDP